MNNWQDKWKGRTFKCMVTGDTLPIPDDVQMGQFFKFGECFIDIGDKYYYRVSGDIEEILSKHGEDKC